MVGKPTSAVGVDELECSACPPERDSAKVDWQATRSAYCGRLSARLDGKRPAGFFLPPRTVIKHNATFSGN
jgi:hypothetical protein